MKVYKIIHSCFINIRGIDILEGMWNIHTPYINITKARNILEAL